MDTRIVVAAVAGLVVGAVGVGTTQAELLSYAGNYYGRRASQQRAESGVGMANIGTRGTNTIGGAPSLHGSAPEEVDHCDIARDVASAVRRDWILWYEDEPLSAAAWRMYNDSLSEAMMKHCR